MKQDCVEADFKKETRKFLQRFNRPKPHTGSIDLAARIRVTSTSMVTINKIQSIFVETEEPYRSTTISAALHQSSLCGRVARKKTFLTKPQCPVTNVEETSQAAGG